MAAARPAGLQSFTVGAPADKFHQLPPNPTDAADLPMQVVYRRPEPFDIDR